MQAYSTIRYYLDSDRLQNISFVWVRPWFDCLVCSVLAVLYYLLSRCGSTRFRQFHSALIVIAIAKSRAASAEGPDQSAVAHDISHLPRCRCDIFSAFIRNTAESSVNGCRVFRFKVKRSQIKAAASPRHAGQRIHVSAQIRCSASRPLARTNRSSFDGAPKEGALKLQWRRHSFKGNSFKGMTEGGRSDAALR